MQKYPLHTISLNQDIYPKYLKQIYDPPAILYCRGNLSLLQKQSLAIVGSRHHSSNAKNIIQKLIPKLTKYLIIISGLAIGIDSLAHEATLENNGQTIAVLGGGIDNDSIYPKTNYNLAQNILEQDGLLISEYPQQTKIQPYHFPRRNRIIAGLSLGVLVIEAKLPSGSLITARHALEQNREVMAIPGTITSETSAGTNYLIKQGSHLITCSNDILEALNLTEIEKTVD